MLHSLSVDVEEYFHASNIEAVAPARSWYRLPSRVEAFTHRALDLFDRCKIRSTFFVLGSVARRHPNLIKEIRNRGHELGSHGYSHRLAFAQTPAQFSREVIRSKRVLEDISGHSVLGFRAPNFSIRNDNTWAYDALIEAGYKYDSSLYPTWHPRYSNLNREVESSFITREQGRLLILPLAVAKIPFLGKELRLPCAGGAYWRLLPFQYNFCLLRSIAKHRSEGFHCYFHPWELDDQQPVFTRLSFLTRFRHYGGARRFEARIEKMANSFRFAPLREVATELHGPNVWS